MIVEYFRRASTFLGRAVILETNQWWGSQREQGDKDATQADAEAWANKKGKPYGLDAEAMLFGFGREAAEAALLALLEAEAEPLKGDQ